MSGLIADNWGALKLWLAWAAVTTATRRSLGFPRSAVDAPCAAPPLSPSPAAHSCVAALFGSSAVAVAPLRHRPSLRGIRPRATDCIAMADLAAASMTRHRCTHPGCAKVFVTQHFLDKHRNARHTVGQATANSDHAAATTAATAAAPNADTEYHMQDDVAPASSAASGASAHSAAASSSAAAAATSTDLNCPTCFCVYTAPVSLSCPHAMCLECCRRWAATSSEMEAASIDSTLTMLGVTDRDFYAIHGGKPVEGRGVETKQLGVPRHMDRVTDWAARCHVCMGVAKPHQDLVVCDSCKLSVHEACYDITNLSDDSDAEWFCDPCKDARAHGGTMAHPDAPRDVKQRHVDAANAKVIANSRKGAGAAAAASSSSSSAAAASSSAAVARSQKKSAAPSRNQSGKKPSSARCCVCSNALDRALYPVQGGGWIHVSCAAFLDGPVSCGHDDDNLVRGVDDIGPQWFRQQCSFCDEPGATVQCKYGTCVKTYHVPCGSEAETTAARDSKPLRLIVLC